ncbi:MAG: GFA family protein [Alphaproteobacteria bacterium]
MIHECVCPCGESDFAFSGRPLLRFNCHCTLCQEAYQAPFVDAVLWLTDKPVEVGSKKIVFEQRRGPLSIDRGFCVDCAAPVFGKFRQKMLERVAFVSVRNMPQGFNAPPVDLHIFYETRQADVADGLPKHQGYLRSQLAFTRLMMKRMRAA